MTPDKAARVERIAHVMDQSVRLPGTRIRLGLDGLLGLVPGIGDTLALAVSAYIPVTAWRAGARKRTLLRMMGNVTADWLIGLVPLAGDLFDIGFKANTRNARLFREEFDLPPQDP
ncbi:hypothetical protein FHS89_003223 [Rubricella aquisinus]|uniref:DUF4112 domain-containing protein n=1 Tax=Rubricella aquisinus TaxID=2028108 RepID=A0A840X5X3_9RHOB|nr:DUF4112 domain-containing protein [Rubricella aquisinus]MBB5517176.1 hypothetical protein [Rubricella aquisinus]